VETQIMPTKLGITRKKKHVIHVVPTKVAELIVEVIAQLIKPTRVPLRYPCMIYFSFKHVLDCPKKTKV